MDYKNLLIYYGTGVLCILGASLVAFIASRRYPLRAPTGLFYLLILSSTFLLWFQILKYQSLHFYVDFSHWLQILFNITQSGQPLCPNQEFISPGALNYFSVHFVPWLYLFAIPFKFGPYGETLIISNVLLMLSSVVPLYKLGRIYQPVGRFSLFLVSLLLWYPTFQYITLYEFEMLRFAIPIMLWMLYFWEKKKIAAYFVCVLAAVLVREEVGLTVIMFGLYALFIEKKVRLGLLTSACGLAGFFLITQVFMPSLRAAQYTHIAMGSFNEYGATFGAIAINLLSHPQLILNAVFHPIKVVNLGMFLLPLLFIPLLRPAVLISVLANVGIVLISKTLTHSSYFLYYLSPSIPFIFYAFIKAWPDFVGWVAKFRPATRSYDENSHAAMLVVLMALLGTNVFFGPSPLSLQFWFRDVRPAPFNTQDFHYSVYQVKDHHRKAEAICALIPDTAVVTAPQYLHPRLYKKHLTTISPQWGEPESAVKADYVVFDLTNNGLKSESAAFIPQKYFDQIAEDQRQWTLVNSDDGYFVFKRNRY